MNLFKKVLTGAFVGAMALAVAGSTGVVSADAQAVGADDVTMNGETLIVSANAEVKTQTGTDMSGNPTYATGYKTADEVLVAFPTVKEKNGEITVTIKEWDTYETTAKGSAVVDLSNLKPEKDNYVAIKTSDLTDVALFKIPAGANGIKGTYTVAASGSSVSLTAKDGKTTKPVEGVVEYRTAMGNWETYDDVDLQMYAQQGATLYFRQAMGENTEFTEQKNVKYSAKSVSASAVYVTNANLPSKEVKVKITKLGSAPKVSADYANKTIKFPKGCEYRFGTKGAWTDVPEDAKLSLTAAQLANAGVIEARTKADAQKKKAASKIGRLEFPAETPVSVVEATEGTKTAVTATIEGGKITVKAADAKGVVEVKNADTAVYELFVGDAAPAVAAKGTKLAAATAKGDGSAKLKGAAGKTIYIRRAADSKAGVWVSDWVAVGVAE